MSGAKIIKAVLPPRPKKAGQKRSDGAVDCVACPKPITGHVCETPDGPMHPTCSDRRRAAEETR
jgi:hypothetical protein